MHFGISVIALLYISIILRQRNSIQHPYLLVTYRCWFNAPRQNIQTFTFVPWARTIKWKHKTDWYFWLIETKQWIDIRHLLDLNYIIKQTSTWFRSAHGKRQNGGIIFFYTNIMECSNVLYFMLVILLSSSSFWIIRHCLILDNV